MTDNELLNIIVKQNEQIISLLSHMADYEGNKTKIDSFINTFELIK